MINVLLLGPICDDLRSPRSSAGRLYARLCQENPNVLFLPTQKSKVKRVLSLVKTQLLHSRKYNVIIVFMASGRAFLINTLAVVLGRLTGKKVIGHVIGGGFPDFYSRHFWIKYILRSCQRVTSPSLYIRNYLVKNGMPVEVIPDFIETGLFPFQDTRPKNKRLLWVRAFHDIYDPEMAIRVISRLRVKFPGIHLTMVGPDLGEKERCKLLIHSLGLKSHITLEGEVPNHKLSEYYHSHEVYLNTTRYESFGAALMEAASSGIPMVSKSVGEIPFRWKHGEDILLYDHEKEETCADLIGRLLSDPSMGDQLAKAARKKVQDFQWTHVKPDWIRVISE